VDCSSNFVKLQERLSRLTMIFKLKVQYNLEIGNIYIFNVFLFFLILNNKGATKIGTGLGNPNLGAGPVLETHSSERLKLSFFILTFFYFQNGTHTYTCLILIK
jgi:hypothetical protein